MCRKERLSSFLEGTKIPNPAEIQFDFEHPKRTNAVRTGGMGWYLRVSWGEEDGA
jgi:hypothetical protein